MRGGVIGVVVVRAGSQTTRRNGVAAVSADAGADLIIVERRKLDEKRGAGGERERA